TRTLARQTAGTLGAGLHEIVLGADQLRAAGGGDLRLRVSAVSSYPDGPTALAETGFRMDGGSVAPPSHAMLLGCTPNPAVSFTRIAFLLPAGASAALRVFDAQGRELRAFRDRFAAGRNEVIWDRSDARGTRMPAGVYFYRLETGRRSLGR